MGGSYALLLPCETREISAAAPFYGEIPPDEKLKNLACPILYVYGENDGWIQRSDVDRLMNVEEHVGLAAQRARTLAKKLRSLSESKAASAVLDIKLT